MVTARVVIRGGHPAAVGRPRRAADRQSGGGEQHDPRGSPRGVGDNSRNHACGGPRGTDCGRGTANLES